jgi:sulfhydrogenase subunit gamma (sulfur reductase)
MNVYLPHLMTVADAVDETPDTRTLRLTFQDPEIAETFAFRAGQFGEYSAFGAGECTFCIASPPTRAGYLECTFKAAGKVTKALRELGPGDTVGFRGPYGNHFPLEEMEGRNLVFVAGGIGLAPLRCVIWNVLDRRDRFGDVTVVYGARSVSDLVYKRELEEWAARSDVTLWRTVDPGGETPDWDGEVGFVPAVVEKAAPAAEGATAIVCGPPVMIKFTLPVLARLGFPEERIYTTLENRMKCGIGKCGRCNIGPVYVCKDGPVFTAAEMARLPQEF